MLRRGEASRGGKAVCEASYTWAGDCRAGNTGMFSCLCVSYLGEIATDPTSWQWRGGKRCWRFKREEQTWDSYLLGKSLRANLPGSAIKCLFEVSGHEFKARPVSMAVAFPLALVGLSGQSWNFAGRCDGGNQGQKAEDIGKGELWKAVIRKEVRTQESVMMMERWEDQRNDGLGWGRALTVAGAGSHSPKLRNSLRMGCWRLKSWSWDSLG